jgi:hypothetical protein
MLISVLLLAAFIGQSTLPPQPALPAGFVGVQIDTWRVVVIVRQPVSQALKSIALHPHRVKTDGPAPEPITPHTRVTLPMFQGIRFTFTPPRGTFDVAITLNDRTVLRQGEKDWGTYFEYVTHYPTDLPDTCVDQGPAPCVATPTCPGPPNPMKLTPEAGCSRR